MKVSIEKESALWNQDVRVATLLSLSHFVDSSVLTGEQLAVAWRYQREDLRFFDVWKGD